jgi:hypothetical protein
LKDKGLLYAVGASIVAHGLAAPGSGCQGLCCNRAPIEARLLQRGSLPRRPRRAACAPTAARAASGVAGATSSGEDAAPFEAVRPRRAWWRRAQIPRHPACRGRRPRHDRSALDAAPAVIPRCARAWCQSPRCATQLRAAEFCPLSGQPEACLPDACAPPWAGRDGAPGGPGVRRRIPTRSRSGRAPVTRRSTRRR